MSERLSGGVTRRLDARDADDVARARADDVYCCRQAASDCQLMPAEYMRERTLDI